MRLTVSNMKFPVIPAVLLSLATLGMAPNAHADKKGPSPLTPLVCDAGDKPLRLSCVHIEKSTDPMWPNDTITLYRRADKSQPKQVVWKGDGKLLDESRTFLTVKVQYVSKYAAPTNDRVFQYEWNGKEYVRRGEI